jgi:hypothetical protein
MRVALQLRIVSPRTSSRASAPESSPCACWNCCIAAGSFDLSACLHRARLGARVGHADEHVALLRGVALHGLHEVGNQVGAALVLVQHLGPRGLHLLVLGLEVVVPQPESVRPQNGEAHSSLRIVVSP